MDVIAYKDDGKLVVIDWNDETYKPVVMIRVDNYHYHNGTVQLKRNEFEKIKVAIKNRADAMIVSAYGNNAELTASVKEYYESAGKRTVFQA